jgi:hypothetical protein
MPTDPNPIELLHCNECRHETRHQLLKEVTSNGSEEWGDDYMFHWYKVHQLFECCGCNAVVLRQTYADSESEDKEVSHFPPRISRHKPNWLDKIPINLQRIMREVYRCLDADTRALPLMGLRTVLDMLIVDQVDDVGSFAQKLEKLQATGVISEKNRKVLEAALDAGHAAAHRGWTPKLAHVHSVIDIVENLLQSVYLLDKVAAEIKQSTPPRYPEAAKSDDQKGPATL